MPARRNTVSLAAGLPLPYKYESLLAEALFGQMLRVPAPAHKPVAYGALMVDLCKLLPTFPRSMSACVRESFSRCVIGCNIFLCALSPFSILSCCLRIALPTSCGSSRKVSLLTCISTCRCGFVADKHCTRPVTILCLCHASG